MKTPEAFLREAFTEQEIAKENSIYPEARQRTYIYKAMEEYRKQGRYFEPSEIQAIQELAYEEGYKAQQD